MTEDKYSEIDQTIKKAFYLIKEKAGTAHESLNAKEYYLISKNLFLSDSHITSTGSLLIFYFAILCWNFGSGNFLTDQKNLKELVETIFLLSKKEKKPDKKYLIEAIKYGLYEVFFDENWKKESSQRTEIQKIIKKHSNTIERMPSLITFETVYKKILSKIRVEDTTKDCS